MKMNLNEINDVAKFLFTNKISAHVDTLDNDFYNGLIVELHDTFIVIDDRFIGETPISFSQIKSIEKFRESKSVWEEGK